MWCKIRHNCGIRMHIIQMYRPSFLKERHDWRSLMVAIEKCHKWSMLMIINKEKGKCYRTILGPIKYWSKCWASKSTCSQDDCSMNLIGSFYKVLSKLLAKRLKSAMCKLVSPSQIAFVSGRQIVYASLIATEWIDSRLKQKKVGILFKLDIEKAFGHMHWDFLINI